MGFNHCIVTRGRNVKRGSINILIGLLVLSFSAQSQFTIGGQLLQRSEYRHGFGKLIEENQEAAFFIGQRARIQVQYDHEKVKFFVSTQDVRTWGNTSQAKETDNFLSVHEAYADLHLHEQWRLKLGRQELNYDNVRFLGNLDWALQARSHDFALLKFETENLKLHFGAGYNQTKESLTRQPYAVTNQYKAAQMARLEQQWGKFNASILFWNNGVEENVQGDLKLRYTQTLGLPTLRLAAGDFTFSGFYYFQTGKDTISQKVRAHNVNAQVSWRRVSNKEKGATFQTTVGFELLTGTSQQASDNINRSYNPFYGTNHAHNGYMDFFYIAGRHINNVGLQDYFVRLRLDISSKFFLSLNGHQFFTAADVIDNTEKISNTLGTELDFTTGFIMNEAVSLQVGYSQVWATRTLKLLQGVSNPASIQDWLYVALLVRPNMKNRFTGLTF